MAESSLFVLLVSSKSASFSVIVFKSCLTPPPPRSCTRSSSSDGGGGDGCSTLNLPGKQGNGDEKQPQKVMLDKVYRIGAAMNEKKLFARLLPPVVAVLFPFLYFLWGLRNVTAQSSCEKASAELNALQVLSLFASWRMKIRHASPFYGRRQLFDRFGSFANFTPS